MYFLRFVCKEMSFKCTPGDTSAQRVELWQDKFWEHMVKKYPDLERGESASETGRDHIPTRVFKQTDK